MKHINTLFVLFTTLLLALFSTPGYSNGVNSINPSYSANGSGLNYAAAGGLCATRYTSAPGVSPTPLNISGIPAGSTIVQAFLYSIAGYSGSIPTSVTHTLMNPSNVSFTVTASPEIGSGPAKCWGETGNLCFRADVTAAITGNGTYLASSSMGSDPTDGFVLMIIYKQPASGYLGSIFIEDGLMIFAPGFFSDTTHISGVPVNVMNAKGFMMFSDVQGNVTGNADIYINGTKKTCTRNFFNYEEVAITLTPNQVNVKDTVDFGSGDCYAIGMMGVYFQQPDTNVFIVQPFTDTLLCTGDSIRINFDVTSKFKPNNVFTIQLSNIYGNFPPGNTYTIAKINTDTAGSYTWIIPDSIPTSTKYRIRVVGSAPSKTSLDDGIDIFIRQNGPKITASSNSPVCEKSQLKLFASNAPKAKFGWGGPGSFQDTLQNSGIEKTTLDNAGKYFVVATYMNGCKRTAETNVIIKPIPANLQILSNNPLCPVDTLRLNASTTSTNVTFSWKGPNEFKDTISNPVIYTTNKTHAGKYFLTATLDSCAYTIDSDIVVRDIPLNLGNDDLLCKKESVTLRPGIPNATYVWQDGSTDTTFHITKEGIYFVTALSGRCIVTDTLNISYEVCECNPFVPSAFTPNNDGINDKVGPLLDCKPKKMHFIILNRFGQRVYSTETPGAKWDGIFKGEPADVGTYFYLLEMTGPRGKEFMFKGDITLIR
ncbi:MAG: gliding motility-associated C-terminal domain-containing protein [Bacteroidetes bacterium]|nr:gliding motility-associated C-terminal domain-containing protein [Bacteroidota bacterium]